MLPARSLGDFQDAFSAALAGREEAACAELAPITAQPAFAVYRNTVMQGCVDALLANYPAVARLVGEEWLRAAAAIYARRHPPRDPCLVHYGDRYAAFLRTFEPARELPYLADVAYLDRCWTEAHVARDEATLRAGELVALGLDQLADAVLRLHAAARWRWFEAAPIATIWSRNRVAGAQAHLADLAWRSEGMLITRPREQVQHVAVGRAACAFLDACRDRCTVADAAARAVEADPHADFRAITAQLLEAGAFSGIND